MDTFALALDGGETLFLMTNAPANDAPWSDNEVRLARDYMMPGGAIYGTHSHGWRRAFLRPPNKHPRVGGLYHVGGSSHPGGGTPTVLLSARITSELIERYER